MRAVSAGQFLDLLLHLPPTILWLPCTIVLYSAACAAFRYFKKAPIVNPTLLTITGVALLLVCSGTPYRSYFEGVAVLNYLLGTAVVALALPLYRNIGHLRGRCARMFAALLMGSLTSIVVGVSIAAFAHASVFTMLSLAPKSATTAVSIEISRVIGGIPAVTAVLTILTGIVGAVGGPYVLNIASIHAPEARGFALGVASHGIATARAFSECEIAGSFAGLGMVFNACLTALIVPIVMRLFGFA
jgi:predicted murein hydrolase (TIGR00659 family)